MVEAQIARANRPRVDIRVNTVHKVYPEGSREYAEKETSFYQRFPWATPELLWWGEGWLEMERLVPILDLLPEQSRKYKGQLWALLDRLHQEGVWHRDASLVNVVIHPLRGPLLIDWEHACEAESNVSYDLYGARTAGVTAIHRNLSADGVWWGGPGGFSPGQYWG